MSFAITPGARTGFDSHAAVTTAEHRKLADAAQQFEGMLLQEMLKPMREHEFCPSRSGDSDPSDSGGDTLSSFGTEVMATAIAKAGGMGIAKRIVAQVEDEKISNEKGIDNGREMTAISKRM